MQRSPLALADAAGVHPADLIATDQIFPDRTGETLSPRERTNLVRAAPDGRVRPPAFRISIHTGARTNPNVPPQPANCIRRFYFQADTQRQNRTNTTSACKYACTHKCSRISSLAGRLVSSVVLTHRPQQEVANTEMPTYETVILGAGPAGTGSLVWAARHGLLGEWLDAGIAIVEQQCWTGGSLGKYALNADSLGGTFLECLDGPDCEAPLLEMRHDPVTKELERWRGAFPPLELVGRFQRRLGSSLLAEVARHPCSRVLMGARALSLQITSDRSVVVSVAVPGQRIAIEAASAVMALGGWQDTAWDRVEIAPGLNIARWRDRIIPSDALLSHGGISAAMDRLARTSETPRAVILGGAHSAFSAAWLLLERTGGIRFGVAGVQILYRSEPRIMYPSREAARLESYPFSEADVCQATGRVHRLGGLRGDGREIWRRMRGVGGNRPDSRVAVHAIQSFAREELISLLDKADLIVPAFGYRMATLPVFDGQGNRIALARTGPAVGPDSRLLAEDGSPIPNIFGIGLGSGFIPWGDMAGEKSFAGQQNSLWLCQNGLGAMVYRGVRQCAQQAHATLETAPPLGPGAQGRNGDEPEKDDMASDPGAHQAEVETVLLSGGRGHRPGHLLR